MVNVYENIPFILCSLVDLTKRFSEDETDSKMNTPCGRVNFEIWI
jgi:hypothetical protein